jgi:hypothetical protein
LGTRPYLSEAGLASATPRCDIRPAPHGTFAQGLRERVGTPRATSDNVMVIWSSTSGSHTGATARS